MTNSWRAVAMVARVARRAQHLPLQPRCVLRAAPPPASSRFRVAWLSTRPDAQPGNSQPSKAATAEAANVDEERTPGEEASPSSSPGPHTPDNEEGASAQQEPVPPSTVWRSPSIMQEFQDAEATLTRAAAISYVGFGCAFLGIAPFSPPNPFMGGLLLASMNVLWTYGYQLRQIRVHLRRNVTEIQREVLAGNADGMRVTVTCDGELVRTIDLVSGETRPTFASIVKARGFLHLDRTTGTCDESDLLDKVLESELIIEKETFTVAPVGEEAQEEADKIVTSLAALTTGDVETMASAQQLSAGQAIGQVAHLSQAFAGIILTGGMVIGIGGRMSSDPSS